MWSLDESVKKPIESYKELERDPNVSPAGQAEATDELKHLRDLLRRIRKHVGIVDSDDVTDARRNPLHSLTGTTLDRSCAGDRARPRPGRGHGPPAHLGRRSRRVHRT